MNGTPPNIPALIITGFFQLALLPVVLRWLARGTETRFRWLRIYALVFGLCLPSSVLIAIWFWLPPDDISLRHSLLVAAFFIPIFAAFCIAFFRLYQLERQKKAEDHPTA